jgi:hypothetical protein
MRFEVFVTREQAVARHVLAVTGPRSLILQRREPENLLFDLWSDFLAEDDPARRRGFCSRPDGGDLR